MLSATAFQIQALWWHYQKGTPFPSSLSYITVGNQLLEQLGEEKLAGAIALIPNNSALSYEQAGAQLAILDLWYRHPELFTGMDAAEVERLQDESPEQLYADGECGLLLMDGKVYRYWRGLAEAFL